MNKINQILNNHDTFVAYIVMLLAILLFGMFVYCAYIAFTINLILGVLTIIIELGLIAWFSDLKIVIRIYN